MAERIANTDTHVFSEGVPKPVQTLARHVQQSWNDHMGGTLADKYVPRIATTSFAQLATHLAQMAPEARAQYIDNFANWGLTILAELSKEKRRLATEE